MDLTQILTKLNDQAVSEFLQIEGRLILTGSEAKSGNIMTYPNTFLLTRINEASYEIKAIGGDFKMKFIATDYWENVSGYIKTGILNITETSPEGCAALVDHFKPTELRFEDIQ